MIDLLFWFATFAGLVALIGFAWRSAMRHRGIRLVEMLRGETVLRAGIDVPVRITRGGRRTHLFRRRGTLVLTRRRLAGFAHRSRFVLVRGEATRRAAVRAEGDWLAIRLSGHSAEGPEIAFRLGTDAVEWAKESARVLRTR